MLGVENKKFIGAKTTIFKKIILKVDISSEKAYFTLLEMPSCTTFDSFALIVNCDFTKNKVVHLLWNTLCFTSKLIEKQGSLAPKTLLLYTPFTANKLVCFANK